MIFLSILPSMYIMETLFSRLVFHDIDTQRRFLFKKIAEKRTISLLALKSPENMEQILVRIHSGACWDFFLRHHPIVKTNGSSCLQCHFGGGNVLCVVSTWMKQINPCYTLSPATDFAVLGWLTSSFEWMPSSMLPNTIFWQW